jgi:hypothetical protein
MLAHDMDILSMRQKSWRMETLGTLPALRTGFHSASMATTLAPSRATRRILNSFESLESTKRMCLVEAEAASNQNPCCYHPSDPQMLFLKHPPSLSTFIASSKPITCNHLRDPSTQHMPTSYPQVN